MLTPEELNCLRGILERGGGEAPAPPPRQTITPGDIVQLHPLADPTFGGMLALVTKASPHELRGYLLRPHRGGCLESWFRLPPSSAERVGRARWTPNTTDFAARCVDERPQCNRSHHT